MLYELAKRTQDGLVVRLLWDALRNQVVLGYRDERSGERFRVDVPNARALDAFDHPNAYRPRAALPAAA
jgi:hypothetical protein